MRSAPILHLPLPAQGPGNSGNHKRKMASGKMEKGKSDGMKLSASAV
jgi:hypothetical protein